MSAEAEVSTQSVPPTALGMTPAPGNRYTDQSELIHPWKDALRNLGNSPWSTLFSHVLDRTTWNGKAYGFYPLWDSALGSPQRQLKGATKHMQALREKGVSDPILDVFEVFVAEALARLEVAA